MISTLAQIETHLLQLWDDLKEIDHEIGADRRKATLWEDDRTDIIARINALEALRLHYVAPEDSAAQQSEDLGLFERLVADRAAALRKQGATDEAILAIGSRGSGGARKQRLENEMKRLSSLVFALDAGLAAVRPQTIDDALVSAARLRDEAIEHGVDEHNRDIVEMLARGLLDWHVAKAGKSAEAVLGVR